MGQSTSIFSNNYNEVNNSILQNSKSYCVNICLNNFNINKISVNNSDISGTLELKVGCVITGASCILKSSLSNDVLNEFKNKTDASIKRSNDIFSLFGNLSTIFSSQSITSNNYNQISNQVTQNLLSVCNFRSESNNNINVIDVTNANVSGVVRLDNQNIISNTKCTQDNMIKNKLENQITNDFKGSIENISCCQTILNAIVGIVAVIAICLVFMGLFGALGGAMRRKKDSPNNNKDKTDTSTDTDT